MRKSALASLLVGIAVFAIARNAGASQSPVDSPDDASALDTLDALLPDFAMGESIPMNSANTVSDAAIERLKKIEGYSATPYPDPPGSGNFSVGYGYQLRNGEWFEFVSPEQADYLLRKVAAEDIAAINSHVKVPLSQNQYDALFLLVYNIGVPHFTTSTLLKRLNTGDYSAAAAEFPKWNKSGGAVNNALVARRESEQHLFLS